MDICVDLPLGIETAIHAKRNILDCVTVLFLMIKLVDWHIGLNIYLWSSAKSSLPPERKKTRWTGQTLRGGGAIE